MAAITSYAQFNAIPFNNPGFIFVVGGAGAGAFPVSELSPRIWGRVYAEDGTYTWQVVGPDANGSLSYLRITWLIQVLKLNLGESPFYSNYGIPAQQSVVTQVFPDFYVNMVQQQFAQYFASLQITKRQPTLEAPDPYYNVNIVTLEGTIFQAEIPV